MVFFLFAAGVSAQGGVPEPEGRQRDFLRDTLEDRAPEIERKVERLVGEVKERLELLEDTAFRKPRFVEFCLRTYKWADATFNPRDTAWVSGTGKHGKVRLLSDNWSDSYYFRLHDGGSLMMSSNPYSNIGIQANYSILSLSFSKDIQSLLHGGKSRHKKWGLTLWASKLYADAYYWKNSGNTILRRYSVPGEGSHSDNYVYSGLDFKAYGLMAFWIFNGKRCSLAAGYNLSSYQRRTAGTWLAGFAATFYFSDFDMTKLPTPFKDSNFFPDPGTLPSMVFSMRHHAYTLSGGYGLNLVLGRHWLANITALPGVGFARSKITFEDHRSVHFTMSVRAMQSLTYTLRQFFVNAIFTFTGNYFLTDNVGFMPGVSNLQLSTGIRF